MGVGVEVRLPSEGEIASLVGSEHDELLLELERIGRMVEAAKLGVIVTVIAARRRGHARSRTVRRRRAVGR
jgi:hypothetical protein